MMRRARVHGVGAATAALMLPAMLLAAVLCMPARLHAQVMVLANSNLEFGQLTPGVAMTVEPTNAVRRAAFSIENTGRYTLSFVLPAQLVSADGGAIPLVFRNTDGRVEIRHRVTTFNPAQGVSIHINPADQRADVYLGGVAEPALSTAGGSYSATITILVVAN